MAKAPKSKLDLLVADLNKQMKGVGRVDLGKDISWLDPERIQTGLIGFDVVTRGGLPRGGMVQLYGPWSTGKTTTAVLCMVTEQRRGSATAFAAGEGFSKEWARSLGLWIPYSDEEYESLEGMDANDASTLRVEMEHYDSWGEEEGFGPVVVIQHTHGDGLLEAVAQAVKANVFSIIVVDSLAVLKNTRQLEEQEIGQEEMGGGGQISMFNRFVHRIFSALNTKYNDDNDPDMNGVHGNVTCLVCLNQARIEFGAQRRPGQHAYKTTGGEGLKHSWHLNIECSRGELFGKTEGVDGKSKWTPFAQEIRWRCIKSKIGPMGRTASMVLYFAENDEGFAPGEVDVAKMIRIWATYYNVIEQTGAWYTIDGKRVNGKTAVEKMIRDDEELREMLEEEILERCRR